MCGRYSLTASVQNIAQIFGLEYDTEFNFPPRYNIAPRQPIHIVCRGPSHKQEIILVRWGLIPSWVKDPSDFATLINARSETILTKPSFRTAIRHRRCLIPCSGYFEWKGKKGQKRPFFIRRKSQEMFAMAGVWESWLGADGSEIDSAAIITVPANKLTSPIHPRMPAIIYPEDYEAWLNCLDVSAHEASKLLKPADEDFFEVLAVSDLVNDPTFNGPEAHQPVQDVEPLKEEETEPAQGSLF